MALKTKQQLVKNSGVTSKGTNKRRFITIHETANTGRGANAQSHANLQTNGNSRAASWHWQVDDKQAIQSFPHTAICWHAGSTKGNHESIGIEICVNSDGDFEKAVANAAELVKLLMKQEKISTDNVRQHNYWSGKNCPTNLRNGRKGIDWQDFMNMIRQPSQPSQPSAPKDPMEKGYLQYSDRGPSVKKLAEDLRTVGYDVEPIEFLNAEIKRALMSFQESRNLAVDGYYGPASQKAMAQAVKDAEAARTAAEDEKQEGEITVADLMKTSTKEGANARLRVLKRFENKDPALATIWREKVEKGEFTRDNALEVIFVAIDRGYITGVFDSEEK